MTGKRTSALSSKTSPTYARQSISLEPIQRGFLGSNTTSSARQRSEAEMSSTDFSFATAEHPGAL